jgi:hypothetical protein
MEPVTPGVRFSEVLAGVNGNNNYEFIELYNSDAKSPIDLKGWSLWYQLDDGQEETMLYRWQAHALIPSNGHYLLGRAGEDFGIPVDAVFEIAMVPQKGGLQLRQTDGTPMDALVWGAGPDVYLEGDAAAGMENGVSLERAPGGDAGNGVDHDDNAADFQLSQTPAPQNTGSVVTPQAEGYLEVSLQSPEVVEPGSQFDYLLSVTNHTGEAAQSVQVEFPIPQGLEVLDTPQGVEVSNATFLWDVKDMAKSIQVVHWELDSIDSGATESVTITISTPWTYMTATATNYAVRAEGWPVLAFGAPVRTSIEGGLVPIGVLKDLVGAELTVEGTATMYTGGYYAGSGVKFYLQDETGGVQVYVPGGQGTVNVNIGARVKVRAGLELYRGALELVPFPEDVEVLSGPTADSIWPANPVSISDAANDPMLAGTLTQVEGLVTRVEEFSYSYEMDLMDDAGSLLTLYVDKLTNINVEAIEAGQSYRATGIIEIRDISQMLYPRTQKDLEEIFPPVLMLDMDAPITVEPGEPLSVTLTAYNYTPDPMTNVIITATVPYQGAQFDTALDDGIVSGRHIFWTIPELAGEGASVSVQYQLLATGSDGYFTLEEYQATASEWAEPVVGQPYFVFLGETVPIWAIQGQGLRSPYILKQVKTAGLVTGIFPELGGFWIQEPYTDADPLTSAGLFINSGELEVPVLTGDHVIISGTVRESSQQTQLQILSPEDIGYATEDGAFPIAVELDPPASEADAKLYYEALEGMLVQVSGPALAVAPTNKYGEYVLVLPSHGVERLWQGDTENNGLAIMVDDGSSVTHLDRSTLSYVVSGGDEVSGLVGPLAYTYGMYKIVPVTIPSVQPAVTEVPTLTPTGPDEFSIMSWNVENLFDVRAPHPEGEAMPKPSAYRLSVAKVAHTILAAGVPTIVGLQEVENIDVLDDIAAHEALAAYGYQSALIEGTDGRGIDNGYLVRGDQAEIKDVKQHVAPEGLTSRPPLLIQVEVTTDSGVVTLFVANNHFSSMSAGELATEPRRIAQAAWNVTVLESVLAEYPGAYVAIIGDLNSFYNAPPIDTLREAGLRHVFEITPEDARYTYVYLGASQVLDHILVTPELMDLIKRVEFLRVNADYPMPDPEDDSPFRKSDHDPVVATFSLTN